MSRMYIASGLRTPFVKAAGRFAHHDSLALSIPVVRAMADRARPDLLAWGQVVQNPALSNLGRELLLEAGLDPEIPAYATQMACSTSMLAAIQAAGMLGHGGVHLALVGGVESMSRVPVNLKTDAGLRLAGLFKTSPLEAQSALTALGMDDFAIPAKGWANRISGRSMGEHTEDTAKYFAIARRDQDQLSLTSHKRAVAAQASGFFSDLIVPFDTMDRDTIPRSDTTLEKLSSLPNVYDSGPAGTLSAGNTSPLTDGAAGVWIADELGLERLAPDYAVELVDWQLGAMAYGDEGILMAPARAIPRLLARHGLRFSDISLFEIHEAFAAQALANIKAMSNPDYRRTRAGVDADLGVFPVDRMNPNGGSLAIGHPLAATGARIVSQAAKELSAMPSGSLGLVSVCADGGQGSVVLLRKP